MEPIAKDSFFVHAVSDAHYLTHNKPYDFMHQMRVAYPLPDGQYEVGLVSASFPHSLYNVKYEEDLSLSFCLVIRHTSRMVEQEHVKTFKLHDDYFHDLQEFCDALNGLTGQHILQDDQREHTIKLKDAFQFKPISNKQVYMESYIRSPNVGIKIVFSPNLQKLLGCTEDMAYLYENTRVLYAPLWEDTYQPDVTAPFVDRIIREIHVGIDIIEEVDSRYLDHRQSLKVIHIRKGDDIIHAFHSGEINYHRLTIKELRSFRLKVTDQNAKPLPFTCDGHRDKTLMVLHFRKIGIGFKGQRPEDRPIMIARRRL